MKTETLAITVYQYAELQPGAQQQADRNIASIIQYQWSNDPAVQQLVGLRPNSTEAEAKAVEPNVQAWVTAQVSRMRDAVTFLQCGDAFDLPAFAKAIDRPAPAIKPVPVLAVPPEKRLVGPDGRLLQ